MLGYCARISPRGVHDLRCGLHELRHDKRLSQFSNELASLARVEKFIQFQLLANKRHRFGKTQSRSHHSGWNALWPAPRFNFESATRRTVPPICSVSKIGLCKRKLGISVP